MAPDIHIRRRTRLPAGERREQIIDVATAIIGARGFWGLALQDVADSCGLTVNGVLHHVGSKDGLLIAVLDHRDRRDLEALADLLGVPLPEQGWSPDELADVALANRISLAQMCDAVMTRNATQPEIVRLYTVLGAESTSHDHPAHDYFAERQRFTLEGFARLAPQRAGARMLARHLLALMDGLQSQWLRDPSLDLVGAWRETAGTVPALGAHPA